MSKIEVLHASEFAEKLKKNELLDCLLLDVRSKAENNAYCLECDHIHMPLHEIDVSKLRGNEEKDIYILCKAGPRAMKAAEYLEEAGFQKLHVIDGGIYGCIQCGANIEGENLNPSEEEQKQLMEEAKKSMQAFQG